MSEWEDERQELIGLAEDFGLCFCEPAWTERGRRDPQCDYHDRVELISDVLAWLKERDAKRDLEIKAEAWDEGYGLGVYYGRDHFECCEPNANPYRAQ